MQTARGLYRRYRASTDEHYLGWARWHAEYLREYRRGSGGAPSTAESVND
ncbi:hypothetical protein ACFC06_09870 [Nocardia sp. NPDC056064]